jgi:ribosomal protein S18 acetylase RimI-like enzyme
MEISLRQMSENDFEAVHDMVGRLHALHVENRPDVLKDTDPLGREDFDLMLKDENKIRIVAETENGTVGFCVVTMREPTESPILNARKIAFMEDLYVRKGFRKSGIGKRLFEAAGQAAKRRGAESLELVVWAFNETACRFYHNIGMADRVRVMELPL